ncbi:hypothetical protein IFR05_016494 [Cadophora sp. M221]|nr:hypothetical protein IFR05_016494 [Cadophora sp. M221]
MDSLISQLQIGPEHVTKICDLCSQINTSRPTAHHNILGLRNSASNGCHCCTFIYKSISVRFMDLFRENITVWPDDPGNQLVPLLDRTLIYEFPTGLGDMGSRFAFRNHSWLDYGHAIPTFELVVRDEDPILTEDNKQWIPRFLEESPTNEGSFALMFRWLETCVETHERCKQTEVVLPKRVLDLRGENPVLVLGNDRKEPYAALSHCWGKKPLLRTTTSTLALRMECMELSTLPRTFQDAILIARNLKVRYLWIDSLCIVQDDTQDWVIESAKMMDYYLKAHITISALGASDSQEGILGDRIIDSQILLSAEKQLYIRSKREQLRTMFLDEPLNTRAWTLQERLISTRIIHFGTHEMIWECNSCSARESGATDFQPGSLADVAIPPISGNFGRDPKFSDDPSLTALQIAKTPEPYTVMDLNFKRLILEASNRRIDKVEVWEHLVTDYLTRHITKNTDRLPAISGLARMLFEGSKFTYLAGLLKEWPEGLTWDQTNQSGLESTLTPSGAPSWSWAAATGPIVFSAQSRWKHREDLTTRYPQIVDFDVKTMTQDEYGQSISGSLTLNAFLWTETGLQDLPWVCWSSPTPATQNSPKKLFVGLHTTTEVYSVVGESAMKCIEVEFDKEYGGYKRVGRLKVIVIKDENFGERTLVVLV